VRLWLGRTTGRRLPASSYPLEKIIKCCNKNNCDIIKNMKIDGMSDQQLSKIIDNRWLSSSPVWDIVTATYEANIMAYKNEPEWLKTIPKKKSKVRANRIFINTEAVINSVIANPAKPVIVPGRTTPQSKQLAMNQEKYFQTKYTDRNVKEKVRKGLRNLYYARLIVIKPFWDTSLNDFNAAVIDPRKVRFSKTATNEQESDFAIEEVTENACAVLKKFPNKKEEIAKQAGKTLEDLYIDDPDINYKEAWIDDYVVWKYGPIILDKKKNPYWDWDGIQLTQDEADRLASQDTNPVTRRDILAEAKKRAFAMKMMAEKEGGEYKKPEMGGPAYYYNHFDKPRKPYIFATMFASAASPIGDTDFITQALPLQADIDETKRNITENAKIMNGIIKVDSGVMTQEDAAKLRWETGGVIWGKGVHQGVTRETGMPLPNFVIENMLDSRSEIDDIMASASAFRGIREGQETRGGRLALIDQSFLRLNELVQVIDYVNNELFNWFYQLAKVNYTEMHYAKSMGADKAIQTLDLMQDDLEDGTEVRIISGKTLPEDRQFKYEQAQKDLELGVLTPKDYLEAAGYDNPAEKAKNLVVYGINKTVAVGITPEEMAEIAPPQAPQEPPKMSMKYEDLPPDGQIKMAKLAGIDLNPQMVVQTAIHKATKDGTMRDKSSAAPEDLSMNES